MGRLEPGGRDRDAGFPYESAALGQRVEGREEPRRFYEALLSGLPDYYGAFGGSAIGDDTAVVWGRWRGTLARTTRLPAT